jgi:hypothetical protein
LAGQTCSGHHNDHTIGIDPTSDIFGQVYIAGVTELPGALRQLAQVGYVQTTLTRGAMLPGSGRMLNSMFKLATMTNLEDR